MRGPLARLRSVGRVACAQVLVALGVLLGWSYVRSRNLLTPIIIHGAWNSGVLTLLFWLTSDGVDVLKLLEVRGPVAIGMNCHDWDEATGGERPCGDWDELYDWDEAT
jgi:hypothetical protein